MRGSQSAFVSVQFSFIFLICHLSVKCTFTSKKKKEKTQKLHFKAFQLNTNSITNWQQNLRKTLLKGDLFVVNNYSLIIINWQHCVMELLHSAVKYE